MIDKQLLDRFLKNECSEQERRLVLEFLENHPGKMEDLLSEEEFAQVTPELPDPERTRHSFQAIHGRLHRPVMSLRRWGIVAASLLVLTVGVKWLLIGSRLASKQQHQQLLAEVDNDVWVTQVNRGQQVEELLLPDGSSAELSPGSRIRYHKAFTNSDRRIVQLEGEGQFKVTGDQQRPFMVQTGPLTTTVLGTWFSVLAEPTANVIKVHLYSGKVQVGGRWKTKDSLLVLRPGDELVYDRNDMLAVIHSPKKPKAVNLAYTTHDRTPSAASAKPNWYMFGGQSLADVFDQLSDYYGVQINYFPADVKNHYFTGKFSRNDSLEGILNDIALLHDLKLTKEEGVYVFRKK